jgi:hypothetical protein
MPVWTFLHVLTMFAAITVIVGAELLSIYAIVRRDRFLLRAYFRVGERADLMGMLLLVLGIVFGLMAAISIGWDLLSGWLILAYVLVGLTIVVGFSSAPYLGRLKAALPEDDAAAAGPELEALLRSRRLPLTSAAAILLTVLIIADMVFKPTF